MVKTPCARDGKSGRIVFAPTAVKKRKHACLECAANVIVHRGPKLAPHFTHLVPRHGGDGCRGGGESAIHRATKEWIKSIANDPTFVVWTNCTACLVAFTVFRGRRDSDAKVEYRWNKGQFVMDVAIATPERVCAVVEIWYTHAAGATKRKTIEASDWRPLPVVEVKAVDLVAENWPRRFECVSPRRCTRCLCAAIRHRRDAMSERYTAYFRAALRTFRVRRFVEAIMVDDAINAVAVATKTVARRWLFLVRAKSLAARLRRELFAPCAVCKTWTKKVASNNLQLYIIHKAENSGADVTELEQPGWYCSKKCIQKRVPLCITCYEPTRPNKWCACKRSLMAKCTVCSKWGTKSTMDIMLPAWDGKWVDMAHPECTRKCAQCLSPFMVSPAFTYATKCFRCYYKNKHGTCWSPNGDGFPDGACVECGKYIRTTAYFHTCFSCNKQ
jgi:hypothetical protein